MSATPSSPPAPRRRGLATVATLAGVGASLSLLALGPSTAATSTTVVPAAASSAAVSAPGSQALASAPAAVAAPAASAAKAAPAAKTAPATKAAPTHVMAATPASSCGGLQSAVDSFMAHFNAAHLETSPGQQVADALDVDQYTKTHTVLFEHMLAPLLGGGQGLLDAFLQHVYAAHLEASPGQQVADIADIDQYVKTHTVMLENMLAPLAGADLASC